MSEYVFKVLIPEGVHARPCARLVEMLEPFTPLSLHCKGKTLDMLSILELMLLQIECGEIFTIRTEAPLPSEVVEKLERLFGNSA